MTPQYILSGSGHNRNTRKMQLHAPDTQVRPVDIVVVRPGLPKRHTLRLIVGREFLGGKQLHPSCTKLQILYRQELLVVQVPDRHPELPRPLHELAVAAPADTADRTSSMKSWATQNTMSKKYRNMQSEVLSAVVG